MAFWNRKQPIVEAKSTDLTQPDDWLKEAFGISISGNGISDADALTVPAVSSAIRLISEAAASLKIEIVATDDKGMEAVDKTHPLNQLLSGSANDWTDSFSFIRDLISQALQNDAGGLAWVNRVDGKPAEIIHYTSGNITCEYATSGTREPSYKLANRAVPARDIIHLKSPFSRSPLSLAKDAIATAKLMEKHATGLFKNGARPSGVIQSVGNLGETAFKAMKAAWRAAHEGPDNAGKTAFLWNGAVFQPLTMNSTDAQFIENQKFQIIQIARAFRVPPAMLYELDRATWSNSEQQGREFLVYTLEPWLRALEGALSRALFTEDERKSWSIRFERDDLTRADLGSRATAYSSLIASRVLNPNEARQWEGLPAYAEGNAFVNPNIDTNKPEPSDGTE
ncbi:phage portal protein [Ahrensia sp. 13_GOM-1096m]|uniref:phage portal protein n=1 Tax=Ahrensia sp. 13_GOM-1096m TaxID=1380380 RepID=UPI00047A7727|nr:phage portal protein [Ahrensia sp. 13_GOM-1096m]